jgi:hypothetical protein
MTTEIKEILFYSFVYYIVILVIVGLAYGIYTSSNSINPKSKYKYLVTLDNRWRHESEIYCDSFNNKTDTSIFVFIDGRTVNLKAKYDVMIEHSGIYKSTMK